VTIVKRTGFGAEGSGRKTIGPGREAVGSGFGAKGSGRDEAGSGLGARGSELTGEGSGVRAWGILSIVLLSDLITRFSLFLCQL